MCCQAIRGTDEALFCQKWLHRYCASVTVQQYKATTNKNHPFLCPCCCCKQQQEEINELRSTVEALKLEICKLKESVSSLTMAQSKLREETNPALTIVSSSEKPHEAGSWATVVRRRRRQQGNNKPTRSDGERTASNSANSNQSSQVDQGNDPNQHPCGHPKHHPKKRVAIQGARKVWGTLRSATAAVVANAID